MPKHGTAEAALRTRTDNSTARKAGRNISIYPLRVHLTTGTQGPLQKLVRASARHCHQRSLQLKIKRNRRDDLNLLAVNPGRLGPPLLHRFNRGIGENRFTLQQLLYFEAPILRHSNLQLHDSLDSRAASQFWVRRTRGRNQSLRKMPAILLYA